MSAEEAPEKLESILSPASDQPNAGTDRNSDKTEASSETKEQNHNSEKESSESKDAKENLEPQKDEQKKKSNSSVSNLPLMGRKILVVEDTAPMRMLLKKTLSTKGALIEEAENGQEALGLLRKAAFDKKPFQMVVMDMMMPIMNGFQTLQHMRSDPDLKPIPVIVTTAKTGREDIVRCAKYGISSYILKPYKTQHIIDTVIDVLENKKGKKNGNGGLDSKKLNKLKELVNEAVSACTVNEEENEKSAPDYEAQLKLASEKLKAIQKLLGDPEK